MIPSIKRCSRCATYRSIDYFAKAKNRKDGLNPWCRTCNSAGMQRWREKNPERYQKNVRRSTLMRWHGITVEEYDTRLEIQGGRCAICRADRPSQHENRRYFDVDHCHVTGAIRGLLCQACNRGLGQFGDETGRLRAAADYLDAV